MKSTRGTTPNQPRAGVFRWLFAFGALVAWVSCNSDDDVLRGQSGSEATGGTSGNSDCSPDITSCPCGIEDVVLRATVLAQDGSELTLRVEEVIHPRTPLEAGDQIRVTFAGSLPCGGTTSAPVGSEALVLFQPPEETRGVCDGGPCMIYDWSHGSARLTPWADTLIMGSSGEAQLTIPAAELDQLWTDRAECVGRYSDWSVLRSPLTECTP